jgi:hypothetical protein
MIAVYKAAITLASSAMRPFASAVVLNLATHIEGLELPPFSPYVISTI